MSSLHSADPHALLEHQDFVRGLARSLLFDDHEVDEVVQQTWLTAMQGGPRDPATARGWLGKVVRSRASNRQRGEGRRRRREAEVARRSSVTVPSAAQIAEREATRSHVVAAVMELAEPYKSTVLLRYFENLSPSEIARQHGIPAATVRTRLKRGLDRLREHLDVHHDGDRRSWCLNLVPLAAGRRWSQWGALLGSNSFLLSLLTGVLLWAGWALYSAGLGPAAAETDTTAADHGRAGAQVPIPEPGPAAELRQPVAQEVDPETHPGVLAAQVGFKGRLLRPDGRPAAGRRVEILAFEANRFLVDQLDPWVAQGAGLQFQRRRGQTDEQGRFEIRGVWPRGYFLLRSDSQQRERAMQVLLHCPAPGEICDLGDVQMRAVATLRGQVVDGDGEPVPGALVWSTDLPALMLRALMAPEADPQGGLIVHRDGLAQVVAFPDWIRGLADICQMPTTRTDRQGHFELPGMQPGVHVLVVRSSRHAVLVKNRVRLKADQDRDLGQLRLKKGETAAGVVLDAAGNPVEGAQVMVAPRGMITRTRLFGSMPQVDLARRAVSCDAQGRFSVPGLPRAGLSIAFRRSPQHPWSVSAQDAAEPGIELRLPPAAQLRVRLLGLEEGARPQLKLLAGKPRGEMLLQAMVQPLPLGDRLVDLGDGAYAFRELVPGTYTLLVQAADRAMQVARLETGAQAHEIVLRKAHQARVLVRDAAGAPLPAARVYLRSADPEPWRSSLLPSFSDVPHWQVLPTARAHSDGQGQALLEGLPAGEYWCTVSHPRFGTHARTLSVPGEALEMRFREPGRLRGRLLDGENPAAAKTWMAILIRQDGTDEEGPMEEHLAMLEADGGFRFAGLAPGKYRLFAVPTAKDVRSVAGLKEYLDHESFGIFASGPRREVEVRAGELSEATLNVRVDYVATGEEGATLKGLVLMDGKPMAGVRIVQQRERPGGMVVQTGRQEAIQVGADGSFDLGRVRPGAYRLVLKDSKGNSLAEHKVQVEAGPAVETRIELVSATLVLQLRDEQGRARPGVEVRLKGERGESFEGRSDARGLLQLKQLPIGTYRVEAEHPDVGYGYREDLEFQAGAQRQLDVTLRAWRKLSGKVDAASFGVQDKDLQVSVYAGGQHYQAVAKDGSFRFDRLPASPLRIQVMGLKLGERAHYLVHRSRVLQAGAECSTPDKHGWPVLKLPAGGLHDVKLEKFEPK